MSRFRCVIVGAGIAGTTAAETLRAARPDTEIVLVSAEPGPLYSRVLLPHYVKGTTSRERCFLKTAEWYDAYTIKRLDGVRAAAVDPDRRIASTDDGRELPYDALVLATSGRARTFPEPLRGVSYLRTLGDADHLRDLLSETDALPAEARRAGIVGGSFIAVEYINIFASRGITGDLFLLEPHFFGAALDAESFSILKEQAERAGFVVHSTTPVDVLLRASLPAGTERAVRAGVTAAAPEHEGTVAGLRTVHGAEHPVALLGVGTGLVPDLGWVRAAGVLTNTGILTNEYLETNVPGIYACGDGAEFLDVVTERRMQVGNWLNAQTHGRTLGTTLGGTRTRLELVSSYATKLGEASVVFVGDTARAAAEHVVVHGSFAEGGVAQFFLRAGRLVGATLVNRNELRAPSTATIRTRIAVSTDALAAGDWRALA